MSNSLYKIVLAGILLLSIGRSFAQEKRAQTGFQFLSVVPDARSAALAGAVTTVAQKSSALWDNPATMSEMSKEFDAAFSMNRWIADINHNAFSLAYRPNNGLLGVFALSFLYVDYGTIEGTIFAQNEQGYLETGDILPNAYALGFGYARNLTNRFNVGGQVKLVHQNLGPALVKLTAQEDVIKQDKNSLSVLAFDFGTTYRTGYKSFVFGMSIRNFSQEIKYVAENFQLPLTFSIGASMDLFDFIEAPRQTLLLTVDAIHPRSHKEQVKIATEYTYRKMLALRFGYVSGADEQNLSFGFGIKSMGIGLDYAYTPFGIFTKVQRISIRFSL